jgi:hypothetical protein
MPPAGFMTPSAQRILIQTGISAAAQLAASYMLDASTVYAGSAASPASARPAPRD